MRTRVCIGVGVRRRRRASAWERVSVSVSVCERAWVCVCICVCVICLYARAVAVAVARSEGRQYKHTAKGSKSLRSENFGSIDKNFTKFRNRLQIVYSFVNISHFGGAILFYGGGSVENPRSP